MIIAALLLIMTAGAQHTLLTDRPWLALPALQRTRRHRHWRARGLVQLPGRQHLASQRGVQQPGAAAQVGQQHVGVAV